MLQQYYNTGMTNYSSSVADSNNSLYYLQSSIKRFTEEVIEQQSQSQSQSQADESQAIDSTDSDDENYNFLTSNQISLNAWVPRVGGVITCLCSLCMLIMAWKRRRGLFHRLVLGT